jgi:hypothetical protein
MARRARRKRLRKSAASCVQLELDLAQSGRIDPLVASRAGMAEGEDDALFRAAVARVRRRAQPWPAALKPALWR